MMKQLLFKDFSDLSENIVIYNLTVKPLAVGSSTAQQPCKMGQQQNKQKKSCCVSFVCV